MSGIDEPVEKCAECGAKLGLNRAFRIPLHTTPANNSSEVEVCRGSGGRPLMLGQKPRAER